MKSPRWLALVLVLVLLAGIITPVSAQDYLFAVPRADVVVEIEDDGTVNIDYTYFFENQPGAHEIDYVDIGMPLGSSYSLSDITADVDGTPVDVERSEFVSGVAVALGSRAIPAGASGTVHMRAENVQVDFFPGEVEAEEEYLSFQFEPNYFGSEFVRGRTDLAVTLVLPPGLESEEPVYFPPRNWPGETAPGAGVQDDGRIFYTWESDRASSADMYIFGAAFPARLVPGAVVQEPFPTEEFPPSGSGGVRFDTGTLCLCLFVIGIIGLVGVIIWAAVRAERKRKLQYLPPKISVEGHGIKRGLTAVEAAILMEQPMDRILTMILFATLRKEAATVITRDPLELDVAEPLPEGLEPYEVEFLQAFKQKNPRERRAKLQDVMVNLVRSVSQKMKGFSLKETLEYYESIIQRAWQQVESADTPEVKGEAYEEQMPWTMLDRRFEERTSQTFGTGPVFVPTWWWRFDPTFRGTTTGPATTSTVSTTRAPSGTGGSRTIQMPNLPGSAFAASVVNGVQDFASKVVGDLTSFTGGVTQTSNPPPKPTSSYRGGSSGGGGGRSCACACACACAGCACACAGGGR